MLTRLTGHPAGFTLIELLVVVAIISILTGIAVPNFLEAQTRSKVSRVANDQRVMATALETYFLDHNHYPPRRKFPLGIIWKGAGDVTVRAEDLKVLTTPVSYISSLPVDVFETHIAPPNNTIDYYEPVLVELMRRKTSLTGSVADLHYELGLTMSFEYGYALMSVGPDRIFGSVNNWGRYPESLRARDNSYYSTYDPTNGTISLGNVWRFQRNGALAEDALWRTN